MKKISNVAFLLVAAALSACGGSTLEFFPDYVDSTAPNITASISGTTSFSNNTTHVSALPATVTFSSNEAATIYYTTDGSEPTTASSPITASANTPTSGPSITISSTILKFFGVDKLSNASSIQRNTIVSP
jgi:hypothetical protein